MNSTLSNGPLASLDTPIGQPSSTLGSPRIWCTAGGDIAEQPVKFPRQIVWMFPDLMAFVLSMPPYWGDRPFCR